MTRRGVAVAVIAAFVLAACGGDHAAAPPVESSAAPTTTSTTTTTAAGPPPDLQAVVDQFVAGQNVDFSVVAVDLATGARGEHLADRPVRSASLYKLFVAAELLRQINDGTLDGSSPIGEPDGRSIDDCIDAMIVVSDNACGAAGLALVGRGALDGALRDAGYPATSLASPQTTSAADVALFLSRARDGTLLGPEHAAATALLYELLHDQQVNDRLSLGLPPGTPLAHKTGDIDHWAHDAGIITTPRGDVLLAVLSGPWPLPCCDAERPGPAEAAAFSTIAALAAAVYAAR